jgi:hypothetical protein
MIKAFIFSSIMIIAVFGQQFKDFVMLKDDALITDLELKNIENLNGTNVRLFGSMNTILLKGIWFYNENDFTLRINMENKDNTNHFQYFINEIERKFNDTETKEFVLKSFEIGFLTPLTIQCDMLLNDNGVVHTYWRVL